MHRYYCLSLCFVAVSVGRAEPPPGYYAPAHALSGAPLRLALHQIVANHKVIPYSSTSFDTADALRLLDEDPAQTNNVLLLYAQRTEPKATFGLATSWNREHQWPNSYGLDDIHPAYSDLHNLRAEDANVNSARGNKYYDFSDPNDPGFKAPAHIEAPLCSTDSDSWEPPAPVRGDIARSLFYMAVRYTGDVPGEPALHLTDSVAQIASTTNLMGRLSTLLAWHQADPVSPAERLRNDLIYSLYQANRNPFVDHPDWVDLTFAPPSKNTPRLEILGANPVQLRWPATNQNPFILFLQEPPSTNWQQADTALVLTNGYWLATLNLTSPTVLLRLRQRTSL